MGSFLLVIQPSPWLRGEAPCKQQTLESQAASIHSIQLFQYSAAIFSCSSHHLSYGSSLQVKAPAPRRHSKVGTCGTVSSNPCLAHRTHCSAFVSLTAALKGKKKEWWRSQKGSDLSPTVCLMAEKPLAASGGGKTQ